MTRLFINVKFILKYVIFSYAGELTSDPTDLFSDRVEIGSSFVRSDTGPLEG